MKQFTLLLVLSLLSASMHMSASVIHQNDTVKRFIEATDIELLLKKTQDDKQPTISKEAVLQEPIKTEEDSTILTIDSFLDSLKIKSDIRKQEPTDFKHIVIRTSLDSLYHRKSNGTIQLPTPTRDYGLYSSRLNFRDTMLYNPLFLPIVFTGRIELPDTTLFEAKEEPQLTGVLINPDKTFRPIIEKQEFADRVKREYYIEHPTLIRYSRSKLSDVKQTATDTEVREKFNPFKELLSSVTSYSLEKPDVEGIKIGRVYWVKSGEHSLQFSQNFFSPNWHKGGTNNLNINNYHVYRVNYDKNKVRFNNTLEWRLSLFNAPDDSLRNYRIGDDLLRYYGDFGFDAYKKMWSYSTNLEVKTQMFQSHLPNKDELRSAFLAPLYVNAGIGMKYDLTKTSKSVRHRKIKLALSLSPLSINYKYVGNSEVDQKRFGIPEDKTYVLDKGSTVTSNLTYDISKYITWTSRFKYFTNYSKVEAEFENTLNMSLSRFFSTRLYLHLRYDDGVPKHEDYNFLQINEIVSFGLNYKW